VADEVDGRPLADRIIEKENSMKNQSLPGGVAHVTPSLTNFLERQQRRQAVQQVQPTR
jgi:hypothetical protein